MKNEPNEYDEQAGTFLNENGIKIRITHKGDRCPPWGPTDKRTHRYGSECQECGAVHGDRYRVTMWKPSKSRISFDFWGSYADREKHEHPRAYDVLACISGDVYAPESFHEFCSDYGYNEDSRQAFNTWKRVDRLARRLRAFLTETEQAAIAEIR